VALNEGLIAKKIDRKTFMPDLRQKVAQFQNRKLKLDLNQFLPAPIRKMTDLKVRIEKLLHE
jgi:hypothetical protein